ncbi:hypothetical protein FH5_02392 [Priestia endophytica]|nr:hypothetical protein FH5_02392 [Priestia endophytica]
MDWWNLERKKEKILILMDMAEGRQILLTLFVFGLPQCQGEGYY